MQMLRLVLGLGQLADLGPILDWGGTAPVTGDDLVFPGGASNLSNTNDLTENTIFNSITFTGSGYTLSGNRIIFGRGPPASPIVLLRVGTLLLLIFVSTQLEILL